MLRAAGSSGSTAVGDITGLGTGVATALAVNVGSAGAPVVQNGALGTPSSGTGTNITGVTAANVTGTGVASATSLALGGATIGSNALAVTGTVDVSGNVTAGADVTATGHITASTGHINAVLGGLYGVGVRSNYGVTGWQISSTGLYAFTNGDVTGTVDTGISRISAGVIGVGTGAAGSFAGTAKATTFVAESANGASWTHGQASELLTLSTSGTTTDTTANLLPANSIIEAVVARVTTTITTATDWKLGDATTAGRFTAANATMAAGTTDVGLVHVDQTGAAGPRQTAAAKVRVTTTGTPGAGVIRITVFYRSFVGPTS